MLAPPREDDAGPPIIFKYEHWLDWKHTYGCRSGGGGGGHWQLTLIKDDRIEQNPHTHTHLVI